MRKDAWGFIEPRDAAHNAAFYSIGLVHSGEIEKADEFMFPVISMLLRYALFPIKHPTYVWSNTEDWRLLLYRNFFKKFEWLTGKYSKENPAKYWGKEVFEKQSVLDFYAGSNPDQLEPCIHYFALRGMRKEIKKILKGLILRLGFFPNGEHILIKPQFLSPIFRALNIPLYKFTDFFFWISASGEIKVPPEESATNKIRMYLYLVGAEKTPSRWTKCIKKKIKKEYGSTEDFFKKAFWSYWKPGSDKEAISNSMPFNLLS